MYYKELLILFLIQVLIFFSIRKKIIRYLIKGKLIDRPNDKKIHRKKIPVTGGIIFFFSILIYIFYSYFSGNEKFLINDTILIFIIGISFTFFIGLIDDILHLKAEKKIITLTIFNILLFQNITFFQTENLIFDNSYFNFQISVYSLGLIISVLSFLAYHYSLVIIDGINGLFGSYVLCFFIIILIYCNIGLQLFNFLYYCVLLVAFLTILNFKNFLFFGNSGSLMLSALLPYLVLYIYNEKINNFFIFEITLLIVIPILDMIRLFVSRILQRRTPFSKDLNHLHHILLRKFPIFISVIIYVTLCFFPFVIVKEIALNPMFLVALQIVVYFTLILTLKKNSY